MLKGRVRLDVAKLNLIAVIRLFTNRYPAVRIHLAPPLSPRFEAFSGNMKAARLIFHSAIGYLQRHNSLPQVAVSSRRTASLFPADKYRASDHP